jgi:CxxC motif-containing protein (DUF1111 family)
LTTNQQAQFTAGKVAFDRVFDPTNGLGPLFNANSCAACHDDPVSGGYDAEILEIHATKFSPPDSCDSLFAEGGPVFETQATPLLQAHGITNDPVPPDATASGRRMPPLLFGLGLVDAIPDSEILANETEEARHNAITGIHGHVNRTIDGRIGRFGHKADTATLFDFNVGAYLGEMGITSVLEPVEKTVDGTPVPPDTILGPEPNVSLEEISNANAFVRFLAPPAPQVLTNYQDQVLAGHGKDLFAELKCAVCHVPEMKTGASDIKALNYQPVHLYSDLLVHDMGTNLADICLQDARPAEFRTALLMGLHVHEDRMLHDGSASNLEQAVELHGGEAQKAADEFKALSPDDKKALLKFLDSL